MEGTFVVKRSKDFTEQKLEEINRDGERWGRR